MTRALPLFLALTLGSAAAAEQVTVFAAASLKTALDEIATAYEATSGDTIVLSYAGSSALARQIQQGAPAQVFVSANTTWMDVLQEDGLIAEDTRADLLANRLALVAHGEAAPVEITPDLDLAGMLGDDRLAMALVDAVPAGIYGKQALTTLGLWDSVSGSVAQTDNVRAALALVSLGEAPFGVTYRTDALADAQVSIAGLFPEDSHDPITYPMAALAGQEALAQPFLTYLSGPEAAGTFEKHGFAVLGD
ncbi:molybdate ABC transporter substrate-binding protein [Ponticoccus alexandrii]|uniref:Molybdate ABC transporter substrate-binding protein n=1 Tax=Ponticoccus alexandrii TaxID=1943633 RepID=A0ABX7F597_9RHOB|nr:molybdate ABC transporter substrate-binding protein [Ponticoccus alexandrii]ETA53617.1 molybdenum ABC transporter substrate-binding protein [Rhodobacteraceae bacterium PD-2]QRF64942.1 molybdate ABC transporter substrate-binding protein [Ponticoccus alexandrii]